MIYRITVPVRGDGKGDNVLAHAARLAHRYGCHITVTHCRPRPKDILPFGVPVPAFLQKQLLEQAESVASQVEDKLRDEFDVLIDEFNLVYSEKPIPGEATVSWVEEAGRQVDVIKQNGRMADLIAVAQPDVDKNLGTNTLKGALFHTGRPVMMCPPKDKAPEKLGSHIAVAWNGSTEATRAVGLTMGMLADADEVSILSAGRELSGATTTDLVEYLAFRGIKAKIMRFEATGSVGKHLVAAAHQNEADLMIMGAYGDSHERETLFGGNTQTIVDQADMPVVLVH